MTQNLVPNPALGCSPHSPTLLSPALVAQGRWARAQQVGDCPTPHRGGLQTQLCPQLAGLIMESHSRTALLRANSTGLSQTQLSTQKISTLALLGGGRSRGTAQPLQPHLRPWSTWSQRSPEGKAARPCSCRALPQHLPFPRVVLARGRASE